MASGTEALAERRRDCIHPEPVTVAPAFDSTLDWKNQPEKRRSERWQDGI